MSISRRTYLLTASSCSALGPEGWPDQGARLLNALVLQRLFAL